MATIELSQRAALLARSRADARRVPDRCSDVDADPVGIAPAVQHREPGRAQRSDEMAESRRVRTPAMQQHHPGRALAPLPCDEVMRSGLVIL